MNIIVKAYVKKPIERAKTRSKTFPGIAAAMAEQWGLQTRTEVVI